MRKQLTTALAGAAIAGVLAFGARAADVTVMTSVPSLGFPFFVHMMQELKDEAQKLGVKTVESDGQNSAPKQTADVEAAVVQGVDGIVISPLDVNAMAPAIKTAIDNGVPVVTIDRRVAGVEGILAHVGADNVKGGEAQGNWLLEDLPERGQDHQPAGPARRLARRSTATRACTTSSTSTRTSTSSWPSRPRTSPATRASR